MKRVGLLFPGQGSQFTGMGKEFYDNYAFVRELYKEASDCLKMDMAKLCFEDDMSELTKTENCQPAVLLTSVAAYKVFEEEVGWIPYVAAGHSLGEYSTLTCSGAIRFSDAVKLVRQRGIYMSENTSGGNGTMAAVRDMEKTIVEDICKEVTNSGDTVNVSAYNSPEQTVISGSIEGVKKAVEKLNEMGANSVTLKVSNAFHSSYMREAKEKLEQDLANTKITFPNWTVLSNVTGKPYENVEEIRKNLALQMVSPIRWQDSVKYMWENGVAMTIEMGPKTVLKNLMKQRSSIESCSFHSMQEASRIKEAIGVKQDNKKVITKCMAIAVATQNTNWDNEAYNNGVVKPYKEIQEMQEMLEQTEQEPDMDQMVKAVNMLIQVFTTKGTSYQEQKERFDELYNVTGNKALFDRIQYDGNTFKVV